MLKRFILSLFATKVKTACRDSLESVYNDINSFKDQYEKIGMKLINIKFREYIQVTHSVDDIGNIWKNKNHLSYAKLYFI